LHLLLTDSLTCPRCGPRFGLILLADRLEARRVLEGRLGCANCRDQYPITSGFADLRPPPARAAANGASAAARPRPDEAAAIRHAALLGLSDAGGHALLLGGLVRNAEDLAGLVGGTEIVVLAAEAAGWQEREGLSRLASPGDGLPFGSRTLRAVALDASARVTPEEAARVVAPLGRLVLEGVHGDVAPRLSAAGLELLAAEGGTLVAARLAGS
jgi:hypothetical protein